jgi:N-acylneuraminate cytidylyltransferase
MWVIEGNLMRPLLPGEIDGRPWHSSPYQALPPVFEQNASLEIAWTRVPEESNSISGERIVPFLTEGVEGFDINDPMDWVVATELIQRGDAVLPVVDRGPPVTL